jgi:hypothetical protein
MPEEMMPEELLRRPRRSTIKIGEPHHFRWLRIIVVFVIVLNLLDGLLTIFWVISGQAEEANPLMAELIQMHPVVFIAGKLALVMLGTYLLWRLRYRATAVISIFVVFLVYYALLLLHLRAMDLRLIRRWFE